MVPKDISSMPQLKSLLIFNVLFVLCDYIKDVIKNFGICILDIESLIGKNYKVNVLNLTRPFHHTILGYNDYIEIFSSPQDIIHNDTFSSHNTTTISMHPSPIMAHL